MFLGGEESFFQQLTDPESRHPELYRTSDRNRLYSATTVQVIAQPLGCVAITLTALEKIFTAETSTVHYIYFLSMHLH